MRHPVIRYRAGGGWVWPACAVLLAGLGDAAPLAAQPRTILDAAGDVRILRTDYDGDGPYDPSVQRPPNILEMRLGAFAPTAPWVDPHAGAWDVGGEFFRIDIVLEGLINPPGPLGYDDQFPVYDPLRYGGHPIFGFVELDMDADEDTGGELEACENRYLGVAGRWGGLPTEPRFAGRGATLGDDCDENIQTAPFVERSGEEFHIAFLGEEIEHIQVVVERPGGDPALFEAGEVWDVESETFHRAHGFEDDFPDMCSMGSNDNEYEPDVVLRFAHDASADQTTISLVFPLRNIGSALLVGPGEPVEPNDGCDGDGQTSVEEALVGLQFSAANSGVFTRLLPEFQLLAGWEFKMPSNHLDPTAWRIAASVGTAYALPLPADDARFIWTDVLPDVACGDFNGDGLRDSVDVAALGVFIALFDGVPGFDDDGVVNGVVDLHDFAENFSVFDTNYDGLIESGDAVVLGDMDLDQAVDIDDVDDFVQALLDPAAYSAAHGGVNPAVRGDVNDDGALNGADIGGFIDLVLIGP